jgi:hypothetical protein
VTVDRTTRRPNFVRKLPPHLIAARTNHHAFLDHLDDVLVVAAVEEEDLRVLRRLEDARARRAHWRRVRLILTLLRRAQQPEPHVARSPFRERDARHLRRLLGVGQRVAVFDLHAKQQLPVLVERPRVGLAQIVVLRESPDLRRESLTAAAAQSLIEAGDFRRKRIARRLDEQPCGFWYARVTQQDAVHARGKDLMNDPVVGAHAGLIEAEHRQRDDDRRGAVARRRRATIDEAAHERAQRSHVEGGMLHVVGDVVRRRLCELLAFLVAAGVGLRVVDRLPFLEHLDRAIDPCGLGRSATLRADNHRESEEEENAAQLCCHRRLPTRRLKPPLYEFVYASGYFAGSGFFVHSGGSM